MAQDDIPSSLCLECKFYNPKEKVSNCYDENSFQVFCITRKIDAVIINCKGFKDKKAVEEVKVIPGHEFENDVMKLAQEAEAQQEAEEAMHCAETEAMEQAKDEALQTHRENEEKQRNYEEGGNNE
jgi:hypothetical protein